ncbi:MAG: hypothetical protein WBP74_07155, partial [Nitrososphaeraceae archaeon]
GEGEFPDMKSTSDLLNCAQDSNKVIKLMQVKVDGNDVSSNIIRQSTSTAPIHQNRIDGIADENGDIKIGHQIRTL